MYIYIYEGFQGGKLRQEKTDALVRRSAKLYAEEEKTEQKDTLQDLISGPVFRTEKGKPYFPERPIEFSVSHTGDLWVCLMGAQTAGVDIQRRRKCRMDKIAKRYYTPDEQAHVEKLGEKGFFQIWTRKEAYAKYTGEGLTEQLRFFSTLKDAGVCFVDFTIMEGIEGACCMKEKEELWIRRIK